MKWDMIRHIAVATRANRRRYRAMIADLPVPVVTIGSRRAMADFYRTNGLTR